MKFEKVAAYPDAILPVRSTAEAGGYDLFAAEDTLIPSYLAIMEEMQLYLTWGYNFEDIIEKHPDWRPTLVPTGVKLYLEPNKTFEISARSSLPRKRWMIVANAPGKVDADYVDNPDNEGHIYVQIINLSPEAQVIKKGEKFAQGSIRQFFLVDDDTASGKRIGGFGSTGDALKEQNENNTLMQDITNKISDSETNI